MLHCWQVLIPNDSRVSTDLRILERLRAPYPRLWLSESFLSSRSHNARRHTSLCAPCFSNCGEGAQKRTLLRGHIAKLSAARFRHSIPDHGLLWLHEVEIHPILSPDISDSIAGYYYIRCEQPHYFRYKCKGHRRGDLLVGHDLHTHYHLSLRNPH